MAKFLEGHHLNSEIAKIFEEADTKLVLISPYIRLHDRYASILKAHINNDKLEIIVVFGKNEGNLSKSMRLEDVNFFKEFPNIEIRYEKRLHAKYYSNQTTAIITSMNLYSYSQDNNIEVGIMTESILFADFANKLINKEDTIDTKAYEYFNNIVINQSELIYERKPIYDNGAFGIGLNKKYTDSEIKVDRVDEFFKSKTRIDVSVSQKKKAKYSKSQKIIQGYCIRTGKEILFNAKMPMCDKAYESWSKFKNEEYPEQYCHFSGEPSDGETTFIKPILKKNWRKSQEVHSK